MATLVTPTNLQKMEFNVTTAEGPSRVTIVTGTVGASVFALAPSGPQRNSFKALLDPTLTPGQFRKATATASLSSITYHNVTPPNEVSWEINDAQATFNDEAGQVQLVIDVTVSASGNNSSASIASLMFQVTTLARV